ncbi:Cold-shock DNA-binding domain-containing protein [Ditylenchus destructor]|nr:Cold-shock DNA-binding domain-containing protein [Ditylenchus destructor]
MSDVNEVKEESVPVADGPSSPKAEAEKDASNNRVDRRFTPLVQRGITGVVNWYNPVKSYGFIKRDDTGADVFVHSTSIARVNRYVRVLAEGEHVEFDVVQGPKGLEAELVTGKNGRLIRGFCKPVGDHIEVYGAYRHPIRRRFPRTKDSVVGASNKSNVKAGENKGKREDVTSSSGSDEESSYDSGESSGGSSKKEVAVNPTNGGDAKMQSTVANEKPSKQPSKSPVKDDQKKDVKPQPKVEASNTMQKDAAVTKSAETKAAVTKAAETKVAETKAADTKVAEVKAAEGKTSEVKAKRPPQGKQRNATSKQPKSDAVDKNAKNANAKAAPAKATATK